MKASIDWVVKGVFIALIFVFLTIVFIVSVFAQIKPFEQIAFGNAEKLRAAIEEACFKGEGSEVIVKNFALPQGGLSFVMQAAAKISIDGDPSYLIYYEHFPLGEAVSWETYLHNKFPEARVFAQIDRGESFGIEEIEEFKEEVRNTIRESTGLEDYELIINNVILTGNLDMSALKPLEDGGAFDVPARLGEWKDDSFILHHIPSHLNKTIVKYFTCEPNSLCVKTPSTVYSFPLKHCDEIDHIELRTTKRLEFPGASGFLKDLLEGFRPTEKDQSNFYFNSPCDINNIKVKVDSCSCENFVEYPIYKYEDEKFVNKGNHKFCVDGIEHDEIEDKTSAKPSVCVVVEVEKREGGGCYTFNPDLGPLEERMSEAPPTPVKDNTKAIDKNIFVLATEEITLSATREINNRLKGLLSKLAVFEFVTWYWPWSK